MSDDLPPWALISHMVVALRLDETQCEEIGKIVSQWGDRMFDCAQLFDWCESPMERLFLLAPFLSGSGCKSPREVEGRLHADLDGDGETVAIEPQYQVIEWGDDYVETKVARVDFQMTLTTPSGESRLLVEIDGHDFHERTKEQAQRDKARDRHVARCGHVVIRFTGSEVYKSPVACFAEALATLRAIQAQDRDDHMASFEQGFAAGQKLRALVAYVLHEEESDPQPPAVSGRLLKSAGEEASQ